MIGGLDVALSQLITGSSILLIVFGVLIGTAAAILPGVSPSTMMALLLPLTFTMTQEHAFMFLVALMASAGFAGSMTSILINVPGDGINAATCLDGYPLARRGKAGVAIGASAAASGIGGIFGTIVLILGLPLISGLFLALGPAEFFVLTLLGITLIGTVSTRSQTKGLLAGMLGMLFGFVGVNQIVGGTRYTFGLLEIVDGIALVPALIGLFALPELYELLRENKTISERGITVAGGVWRGVLEVLRRPVLMLRSASIGIGLGLMPGVGQSVASWVSYYAAVNASKRPETFGRGNIEGVIAPEATIDAKEAASMFPVLAFGLPAGVSSAILLSAFQIHGVVPGQALFREAPSLIWVMILTMTVSSVSTSILGLLAANSMVKLTLVPVAILAPIIYVLGLVGAYSDQGSLFGVVLAVAFGLLGVAMGHFGYPRAPLLVGMILVPLAEKYFHQALQISRGSYEFLLRPITFTVLLLIVVAITLPLLRKFVRRRRGTRGPALIEITEDEGAEGVRASTEVRSAKSEFFFALALLAIAVTFLVPTLGYSAASRSFPLIVLAPMIGLLVVTVTRFGFATRTDRERARPGTATPVLRPIWLILSWFLALPAVMWLAGIVVAVFVYTIAFIMVFEGTKPDARRTVIAVVAACTTAALTHFVFASWLGIRLWEGAFR